MPLSCLFSFSNASIAASTTAPISAVSEALTTFSQRASTGTKNMLSPIYSSGSSSKPSPSATSSSCLTLKQSLIYFRNTSPSTTLLYSAASRLPRNSFAESHNVCSMVFFTTSFVFAFFAIIVYKSEKLHRYPCEADQSP